MEPSIRLVPMGEEEFARFREFTVRDYSESQVVAGYSSPAAALARSEADLVRLLPEGRQTPSHRFWRITGTEIDPTELGYLWAGPVPGTDGVEVMIYSIYVHEVHRGRGAGSAAIRALTSLLRAEGIRVLRLHVFGFNVRAISLYERLGFSTTSRNMALTL